MLAAQRGMVARRNAEAEEGFQEHPYMGMMAVK